jgi:hypothetical protein
MKLWIRLWVILFIPLVPFLWILGKIASEEPVRLTDWINALKQAWK